MGRLYRPAILAGDKKEAAGANEVAAGGGRCWRERRGEASGLKRVCHRRLLLRSGEWHRLRFHKLLRPGRRALRAGAKILLPANLRLVGGLGIGGRGISGRGIFVGDGFGRIGEQEDKRIVPIYVSVERIDLTTD
jgi:hypothetical protein